MDFYKRALHSIWLISVTLGAVYYGGSPFIFVLGCISMLAYCEWYTMSQSNQLQNYQSLGYIIILSFQQSIIYLKSNNADLLQLFTVVWTTDTCSYLAGNLIGGTKLSIYSPNKTYSGLIGGLCLGTYAGNLIGGNVYHCFFLSCISQIGDFVESLCKRAANIKDSNLPGIIIPGHGGILDRIDGLLFTAPFAVILKNYFS